MPLDLLDALIEQLDRNSIQCAGTLSFPRTCHSAVDSRLFVVAGRHEPVLNRPAFEFLELPTKDVAVKGLYTLRIIRVNFKMRNSIHVVDLSGFFSTRHGAATIHRARCVL